MRKILISIAIAVTLAGCSSKSKKDAIITETITPSVPGDISNSAIRESSPMPEATPQQTLPPKAVKDQTAPAAAEPSADRSADKNAAKAASDPGAHDAPGVDPDTALRYLVNGNIRYTKRYFRADGRLPADRQRNAKGQHPHAIVLSCADSRVPPEIIFDQGIGEIFTIRVAGEALDDSVVGSIEYGVHKLHARLLVVLGHTSCGAVDTAMKVPEGQSTGSPAIDSILKSIRPHLSSVQSNKPSPGLEVESAVNADGVARDLLARSKVVRDAVESGQLKIKTGLYWLDSGRVKFY